MHGMDRWHVHCFSGLVTVGWHVTQLMMPVWFLVACHLQQQGHHEL